MAREEFLRTTRTRSHLAKLRGWVIRAKKDCIDARSQGQKGGARPRSGTSVVELCGSRYLGGPRKRLNPAPLHPLFYSD